MRNVQKSNLQKRNISDAVRNVAKIVDKCNKKDISLKIKLEGENTDYCVAVSKDFYNNAEMKDQFIRQLEEKLCREVALGTRHVYVGEKLC